LALPLLKTSSVAEDRTERKKRMADHKDDGIVPPSWDSVGEGEHDRTLVDNWLLQLRRERFRSRKSGTTHDFYVAYLADGVHVIAVTPQNEIVMVRQFRVGLHRQSLETPGGLLEPGEDPWKAGARELLEETGYAGDTHSLLGTLSPNPGLLAQRIATIVILNVRRIAEPAPDQTEELTVELIPVSMIQSLINQGDIEHAVCVAGLLWWLAQSEANRGKP
jgi:8-oxo-dGTP pyrophosphatase MutT (NUDIX family)